MYVESTYISQKNINFVEKIEIVKQKLRIIKYPL